MTFWSSTGKDAFGKDASGKDVFGKDAFSLKQQSSETREQKAAGKQPPFAWPDCIWLAWTKQETI